MLNYFEANQPTQISETLYEVYGKIHRVTELTLREHQILQTLQQDPFLKEEHRDMLNRIFYKLNRTQRRRKIARSASIV
ncbi:MAG: hypothetical protein F6J87_11355 [Spirulina sp. SIO3F2]|nr:hypothetical protein [Spirulina sp. SIO3F2]